MAIIVYFTNKKMSKELCTHIIIRSTGTLLCGLCVKIDGIK